MSGEAVGYAFRHSPLTGAALLVHVAIADSVNDQNGNEFWMKIENLAKKARVSERKTREAVSVLIDHGLIEPVDEAMEDPEARRRAGHPIRYRFVFDEDQPVKFDSGRRRKARRTSADSAQVPLQSDASTSAVCDATSAASSDVTQENPTGEPKGGKPRRARFVEYDALMEVWGSPDMTREEQAFFAKTARSLKAQGKSPSEIIERGRRARARHPDCTVNVLLTRWSNFAPPNARRGGSTWDDVARADRERAQ